MLLSLERGERFRSRALRPCDPLLQEVDLEWAGNLHAFFAERGYAVVFAQYGAPQSFQELPHFLATCLRCLWSETWHVRQANEWTLGCSTNKRVAGGISAPGLITRPWATEVIDAPSSPPKVTWV